MGAPIIQADSLSKAYGGRHLFDDAVFLVDEGDHVAIVGANGAGKSTLLRVMAGRERPDHGTLKVREGVRAHWFDQHPHLAPGATVRDVLSASSPTPVHLEVELARLEALVSDPKLYESSGYEEVLERYAAVQQEIRATVQPPVEPWRAPIVREMGFDEEGLEQPADSLSGGELTRLLVARTLAPVRDDDLVVLDEPTNHLDVDSIEWLEDWINACAATVLVVAHDRAFLDNVAERVFEMAHGGITGFPGNYSEYVALRDQERDRQAREAARLEREYAHHRAVLQQYRHQKRFDGQYASRKRMIERYRAAIDRTPDPVVEKLTFGLKFEALDKASNEVLRVSGLTHRFGDQVVLSSADLEVSKGDRVALVGPNGAGKSTFLEIVTGRLEPDAGDVRIPPGVRATYFSQQRDDLDPRRTLREEVLVTRPDLEPNDVKALLGRFRFNTEVDLDRRVETLSGGERARVSLLKVIVGPSNFLILDEPTNHLDLTAQEVVVHALNAYHGTLLIVSHDRYLLDGVTTRTAVLSNGRISVYPGDFTSTRQLHRAAKTMVVAARYVVTKGFTDWGTKQRYTVREEREFTDEAVAESHSLRNAVSLGWLRKVE